LISDSYFPKSFCNVCEKYVKNLKSHSKSKRHISNIYRTTLQSDSDIDNKKHFCEFCKVYVSNLFQHKKSNKHFRNTYGCKFKDLKESIDNKCLQYSYSDISIIDPLIFMRNITPYIKTIIKNKNSII
jgi:hypothetical protein